MKIRRWISFWFAGKFLVGVVALVIKDDALLLVRNTYQYAWALPGGFLKKGEQVEVAIMRELAEETGLEIAVEHIFKIINGEHKRIIDIIVICRVSGGTLIVDNEEVSKAKFFALESLPTDILAVHKPHIEEYLEYRRRMHVAQHG